jgi:hypothetical protein
MMQPDSYLQYLQNGIITNKKKNGGGTRPASKSFTVQPSFRTIKKKF